MFKPLYLLRFALLILVSSFFISALAPENRKKVEIQTIHGNMVVELFNETPVHRDNFLKLVNEGFYNDLLFHRVISEFMLQGGDPNSRSAPTTKQLGTGGPGYTLPAEIIPGMVHTKGALAAARQGDQVNPEKRSSGSQFYIVQGRKYNAADLKRQVKSKIARYYQTKDQAYFSSPDNVGAMEAYKKAVQEKNQALIAKEDAKLRAWVDEKYGSAPTLEYTKAQLDKYATDGGTPHLDGDYTVFGQVVAGLEVIDKIAAAQKSQNDRPIEDIKMTIRIIE